MRLIVALIAAFFAWWIVSGTVSLVLPGLLGALLGLVAAIMVFFLVKGRGAGSGAGGTSRARYPQGFEPAFEHDNIAIDQRNGKLWLRDKGGYSAVIDKGDILRWNLAYISSGIYHVNNRLEIHVRDLNRPKFEVPFQRHSDRWKWSAPKNHQEGEEWESRLTTWINNT